MYKLCLSFWNGSPAIPLNGILYNQFNPAIPCNDVIACFISVLNDIASTMFNKKFIHEIFLKHTPLYSKKVLRAMFDRLAHASIMRLNAGSMDKVF